MSRSKNAGFVPSYRLHKPSGQARVIIDGEHIYLGLYGSPESHERYARLIAERVVSQNGHAKRNTRTKVTIPPIGNPDLQICELVVAYMRFAKGYYIKDSEKGKECTEIRLALRPLLQLYTNEKARNFGPLALKAVRQCMIESDLCRGVINRRVNKIKRMFKWAVSEELVPSSAYEGLRTVTGLLYGRTTARESEPIKPVEKEWVDAILPYVWPPVAAMIQVQWHTGMRPGEVVLMRPCDIDMSGDIWVYEPQDHKNRWRNHRRLIPLGRCRPRISGFHCRRQQSGHSGCRIHAAWRKGAVEGLHGHCAAQRHKENSLPRPRCPIVSSLHGGSVRRSPGRDRENTTR